MHTWFPEHERSIRRSTADSYKTIIINHIAADPIGQIELAQITKQDLQSLFARLERKPGKARGTKLTKKRLRNIYSPLSIAFDSAVEDTLISHNPISTMKKPRLETPSLDIWTDEQVRRFLALVETESPRMKPLYLLAAFTGMRRGEYAGLRWTNVDFDAGTLSVVETRLYSGGEVYVGEPKAKASRQTIALASDVIAALAQAKAVQEVDASAHGNDWINSGYVLTKPTGEPLHPDYITKRFRRDVTRSGIPNGIPLLKLHGLRHIFATAALGASANPKDVSTYLGHGHVNTTLTFYSQDRVGAHAEVARRVQDRFHTIESGPDVTIAVTNPEIIQSAQKTET